jgi:hypothetical protein
VSLALVSSALGIGPIHCESVISVDRGGSILWIDVGAAPADGTASTIHIKAARNRRKPLYQRGMYPYPGPAHYRCGIDAHAARARRGTWTARVAIDGLSEGRTRFEVRS